MTLLTQIVIITTLFTGFSGLVYEVTWQKYLANILGSQAQATALVLAVFLGGLAVGYQFFGNLSQGRSARSLVKMTGWAEILIGLWAFFFDSIFAMVMNTFGILDPSPPYSFIIDIFVSIIVIGFPTVLMGVTLPLLTQALSTTVKDSGPMHARIYSVNTAGAFFGCLIGGFIILPKLGLPFTMFYLSFANLGCGAILIFISKNLSNEIPASGTKPSGPAGKKFSLAAFKQLLGDKTVLPLNLTALLAGFYALTIQTALIRMIGITMGSSEYAFSMVVSAYILLLAYGAWKIAKSDVTPDSLARNQIVALVGLAITYLSINYWPYTAHLVRIVFAQTIVSFYVYHAMMFCMMLIVLYIPVGAMGRTMPLLFRSSSARVDMIGKNVGTIYAWNAIGCVAGAYFGGYLLYYYFNIDMMIKICMSLTAVTVLLTLPAKKAGTTASGLQLRKLSVLVAAATIAVFFLPPHIKDRLAVGLFRAVRPTPSTYLGPEAMHTEQRKNNDVLFYKDGPSGSVAILENKLTEPEKIASYKTDRITSLIVNGKSDGSSCCGDKKTFELSAHLPAMLQNGTSGNVGVIGFGTGLTIGVFANYENINNIDVYEISPTIQDIASHFDYANGDVTHNPKVTWTIGDAFRSLSSTDKKYSIIMSEPSNPWVAGVERLFSQDFYRLAKTKLEKGGVYAQWFHLYSISEESVGMIVKTFSSVFPHVRVFALEEHDVCLIGSEEPIDSSSVERMTARFDAYPAVRKKLSEIDITTVDGLLGQEYAVIPDFFRKSDIHSLDFPRLSYAAGVDFYLQESVNFDAMAVSTAALPWYSIAYGNTLLRQKYSPEKIAALSDQEAFQLISDVCNVQTTPVSYDTIAAQGKRSCIPMFWSVIDQKNNIENIVLSDGAKDGYYSLSNPTVLPTNLNAEVASGYLAMITKIGPSGLPISSESIEKLTIPCGNYDVSSAQCQTNRIKVDIAMLDSAAAKAKMNILRKGVLSNYVSDKIFAELDEAIESVDLIRGKIKSSR